MSIERPSSTRLAMSLVFGVVMLFAVGGFLYAAIDRHLNPLTAILISLVALAICGLYGYWLGGPCRLSVDDQQVHFSPPIGQRKSFPRSRLATIVLVRAVKATASTVEFRAADGTVLLSTDTIFGHGNFEQLAAFLNVPLQWGP